VRSGGIIDMSWILSTLIGIFALLILSAFCYLIAYLEVEYDIPMIAIIIGIALIIISVLITHELLF
jgi:hypothetical protein